MCFERGAGDSYELDNALDVNSLYLDAITCASRFMGHEDGLARFLVSQAVPMDSCGNVELRDREHADGDRFPSGDKVDH